MNGRTLFSRLHQFAAWAYNPVFITGLNFWQGGAANYWGHNAIIRIAPFLQHCRLPKLPGREPLGGSILSHDFVEAALMRRAGWGVYLASELHGSYEELPPSLISYAVRDRRWCQGNLQHARLLFTPGLHLVNRLHLGMGVMSYVTAPLWMLAWRSRPSKPCERGSAGTFTSPPTNLVPHLAHLGRSTAPRCFLWW